MKSPLSPWPYRLVAASLLLLMALLAGGAALRESVTVDEVAHVGAGVSYLQKLDLRMNLEHPPLAKVLAAVPLVLHGVRADYANVSWTFSGAGLFNSMLGEWAFGHWLITRWNDPAATMAWARAPMLLLTLVLGYAIYRFGSRLADARGGLLCLCAFVSMPAFLAFGPLVLTDVCVTLFSLLTLWALAGMWQSPSRAMVAKFALALAAALLSKFSAGLLLAACLVFALSLRWFPVAGAPAGPPEARAWRRKGWRNMGKGVFGAALVVYLAYLVLSWNQPSNSLAAIGGGPVALVLRRLLMPPSLYGGGLIAFAVMASRPTFILGHAYPHGVWFYFPVLFLLKSTLAFLGLLLLAVAAALVAKVRLRKKTGAIAGGRELQWRAVWLFLLVFLAACMLGRLDLSIRHFALPLVLMILVLAPLPRLLDLLRQAAWKPARLCAWACVALAGTSAVSAIRAYPYYMPFLNSLRLGHPGYLLVNDSNLDWNQALPEVRRFAEDRGLTTVLVDPYGFSEPSVYVPQARFWNCQEPSSSDAGHWAVVSANMIVESHNCPWLLRSPHQSLAGGSMYAFQLPESIPPAGSPAGPPLPGDYHNLAGTPGSWPDLRLIFLRGIRDPRHLPDALQQLRALATSAPPGAP
ncbi:MAG: glycosyltransferase family 39 protein [Acidobacteriia bacterium]|nr:glycosyltransferase family 39 protein [Terriglobia bacterium]